MARTAMWRDVSKTTKNGLKIPEYRLHLPGSDVVVKLVNDVYDPNNPASHVFCVRYFPLGICGTPLGEIDPEKAKKAAVDVIKRATADCLEARRQDLASLDNIVDLEKLRQKGQKAVAPEPQKAATKPSTKATRKRKAKEGVSPPTEPQNRKRASLGTTTEQNSLPPAAKSRPQTSALKTRKPQQVSSKKDDTTKRRKTSAKFGAGPDSELK